MELPKPNSSRESSRLLNWPILFMMVNSLRTSFWFRTAAITFVLGLVGGTLFILKIWRTTPEGLIPVVRISGLDVLQAASLERAAQAYWQKGATREGFLTYRVALANTPASVPLLRRFLAGAAGQPRNMDFQSQMLRQSAWLLRLTGTNMADLALMARLLDKYDHHDWLVQLLNPLAGRLDDQLTRQYLKSLFLADLPGEFAKAWRTNASKPGVAGDPELRLYRMAYLGGWDPANVDDVTGPPLESFFSDPGLGLTARHLYLRVADKRSDAKAYWENLEHLVEAKDDRLIEHVRGWRLLAGTGRREEATRRAVALAARPANAGELMQLTRGYLQLDLTEQARKTLETFASEYAGHEPMWLLYADLLGQTANWPEMRELATRLRLENQLAGHLDGFAYFLEGWVEARQNRRQAATASFARIPQAPPLSPELLVFVARKLVELGAPQIARQLIAQNTGLAEKNPDRLDILASVAFATKDEKMLIEVTGRAYELTPRHWPSVHNYAAALLITRQQPAKAMTLTVELLRALPKLAAVRVNHALALIQNNRVPEAEAALKLLTPEKLNDSERTAYYFARLEIASLTGNARQAQDAAGQLNQTYLFPSQQERVRQLQAGWGK